MAVQYSNKAMHFDAMLSKAGDVVGKEQHLESSASWQKGAVPLDGEHVCV